MMKYLPVGWVEPAIPIDKQARPLLGIAALNPTYELGRSDFGRDPGVAGTSRPRPPLRATVIGWVGWMTLFSSTIAIGGWVKRHPPYGSGQ